MSHLITDLYMTKSWTQNPFMVTINEYLAKVTKSNEFLIFNKMENYYCNWLEDINSCSFGFRIKNIAYNNLTL